MDHLHRPEAQSPTMSRRELDRAIGVLMVLRRCREREAFQEIADAVHRTGIGLSAVAHALLALVSGCPNDAVDPGAVAYWRNLIPESNCLGAVSA